MLFFFFQYRINIRCAALGNVCKLEPFRMREKKK